MSLVVTTIGVKTSGRAAWLDEPAAAAYRRTLAAGNPAGGITDAGRTRAEQEEMYNLYLAGKLTATAARPGESKHETGRALDLAGAPQTWMRAWGKAYGWLSDQVPNEPWHFEYHPTYDKHAKAPAPAQTPTVPAPEEDEMQYLTRSQVEAAYWQMGRPPTNAEVDMQILRSVTDGVDAAQLLASIKASEEYQRYMIRRGYQDLLGREPSQADSNAWLAAWRRLGWTDYPELFAEMSKDPAVKAFAAKPAAEREALVAAARSVLRQRG